ncbi:dehydrogenase/reductase SDR family member 8 precursor [Dendryphion nanum]|uniref:Short-chain dehydrogenase/reductase 3 n=1 Tax=Dendryphion nanum TaxID=256645 RepID=A0A9P9IFL9_9PLEO|nr:dehydrogenase/reductase SDR family member 8 precursor [Dendryphion nanum]
MSASGHVLSNLVSLSIRHILLNPILTGALLWILTKGPTDAREFVLSRFTSLRDPEQLARVIKALKGAFVVGLFSTVDNALTKIALNAWRVRSQKKQWDFAQELAVVTGGCSGIGELTVKGLLDKGIKVAILDIQQLPASLQGDSKVHFFACDVADPAAVYSTAEKIRKTIGSPSILINNAGIGRVHSILDISDEWLQKIIGVNLISNFTTVKAFLPDMIDVNKGHIVTVASVASYLGVGGMADYCSTKAGVLSFHEALNQELKYHYKAPNVLTTSVHPNWVRTPLIKPFEKGIKGPIINPQQVADAIVAQIVKVEGGQLFLPRTAKLASWYRGAPNWVQELVRSGPSRGVLGCLK